MLGFATSLSGTNIANPTDKDNIISDFEQIQLTNMQSSGALRRSRGAPLSSIFVTWICEEQPILGLYQLDLQC